MTVFVILAAGRGGRMGRHGRYLHKALLPLDGRAVLSCQIALAPPGARVIIAAGFRSGQLRDYLALAHPDLDMTFVPVPGWDAPGGGPGASLLACRDAAGDDDLVFTSCDTLWEPDPALWRPDWSWAAVAPVPPGTPPERWCRIHVLPDGRVLGIRDRAPAGWPGLVYTGLARVSRRHLPVFWRGLEEDMPEGERQVTPGLAALAAAGLLSVRRITWTDTGDEAAYAAAVAARSGYDWAKPGEVTYVLPETGRVVRFCTDPDKAFRLAVRHRDLAGAVPRLAGVRPYWLARRYVPGVTAYEAAERDPRLVPRLLDWAAARLWRPVRETSGRPEEAALGFYRDRAHTRIALLAPGLRETAARAVTGLDWHALAAGCEPVTFHGDFNLGNVIVTSRGGLAAIDWREDFAGQEWGDRRYDLGKLAAGMIVHWGRARCGDFAPWPLGGYCLDALGARLGGKVPHDILVIAGLSLINCAPLHAPPLDEVCVARGAALLEEAG